MGLKTQYVEVSSQGGNVSYYESLGYEFPRYIDKRGRLKIKRGTKIKIKIKDLKEGSDIKVLRVCDGCGEERCVTYDHYKNNLKENNKIYCHKCSMSLFTRDKIYKTKLKNSKSFEQWCIDNNRQDVLDRWDYNLNNKTPSEVSFCSNKKHWFKCPSEKHKSELKNLNSFTSGYSGTMQCKKCNSFAQYLIDLYGENALELYWSDKNTFNPWEIPKGWNKKVWIKCQEKDYHEDYYSSPNAFMAGNRCPYCTNRSGKVHPKDSLGQYIIDNYGEEFLNKIWSDKNDKTAFEYKPFSGKEVWWKCPDGKHDDFKRKISYGTNSEFRCPECVRERNESFLQEKVRLYLNELGYEVNHEHNCSIIAHNPKYKGNRGNMPYDNEVILTNEKKLIVEVMGKQHYELNGFHNKEAKRNNTTPKYEFFMQRVRDRYKRLYAKSQGYEYLEIPYWTDNKDEEYKKLINNKINEILNKNNKKEMI